MKRRKINTFSLSFLDCICCGLGAVILLFVLVNAKSAAQRDAVTTDLRAEVDRMEQELLEGKKDLVEARNAMDQTLDELEAVEGRSREVIRVLEETKLEIADRKNKTLATKEHVNKLKADLKSLDEELRRLKAGAKTQDDPGGSLRRFPGSGDRHYLTDLKTGGSRIVILVDASASMLDETIVGIIRRRNLSPKAKIKAPKWQQAVATVDWLTSQLPLASKFQIFTFNEKVQPLLKGTEGRWLDVGDVEELNRAVRNLRQVAPENGTSLIHAFKAMRNLTPAPDNIFLLIDSLPTMGEKKPWSKRISSTKRYGFFEKAIAHLPSRIPVNIILYPMEGDPFAADAYWRLAKDSRGSFLCPSKDWP